MSLTPEAIKHIEGRAKAGDKIDGLNVAFDAVLIPNDMTMQTTEHLQEFKNRFEGFFHTDSINSFAEYVNKQPKKSCFINSRKPKARAVFDIGTLEKPEHCVHTATIELATTAAFDALNTFTGHRRDQSDLAEFMEDWRFCITATDDTGEEMDTSKAIMAIRKITIDAKNKTECEVKTFSTSKSINEQIEANSQGDPLPAWITFSCIPYHGVNQIDLPMRVQASVSRGEISFNMKIQNYEQIIENIVDEFRELVTTALDDNTEIFTGTFLATRNG